VTSIQFPLKRHIFACIALVCAAVVPLVAHAQQSSMSPATAAATAPELSPEERRAYNEGLAEARRLMGEKQWARAAARLDTLVQQRPREAQARFLKGVVLTEQGDSDAAIATFRGLTQDYPEIPEPYNNLAVLYARKGEIASARIALETAIQTAPNWAVAHENLADIYLRLAVDHYDRAAQLDPANRALASKLKLARDLLASATPR
jgi:Flp pilus assembly protein TadD